ncbi:MAG: acyltransferase [Clostridiales bacterium]|nr:acyltransferase [Clostridiales bacterium]
MNQKRRNDEVDVLRGLAAILMILGHSFIVYPVDISGVPWCKTIQHFIYTFHMELFFVLAGTVYKCENYRDYIVKKAKRILLPYIFFGVFTLLCKALGGALVNGTESITYGMTKFLYYGGNYWFLYTSFILFAVYPFIEKVVNRMWKKIVLGILLLLICEIVELPSFFMINRLFYYLPYFIFGNCIKKTTWGGRRRKQVFLGTASFIAYCLIDSVETIRQYDLGNIMHFVRAIAIIIFLFCCANLISGLWGKNYFTKWLHQLLVKCSRYSLQIYLFNGYLLTFFRTLVCTVLKINIPVVIVLVIWIGDIALTLVTCKYIIPRVSIAGFCCGVDGVIIYETEHTEERK